MKETARSQARQYARALFEVAESQGADESVRLRDELRTFVQSIENSDELQRALEHPAVTPAARAGVLKTLAETAQASPLVGRVLALLAERGHMALLSTVSDDYGALVNAARGVVTARAVGAVEVSAAQTEALVRALGEATGRDVELTARVDPKVLGGLQVTVAGRTYDGTVRGHLAALKRRLASGL